MRGGGRVSSAGQGAVGSAGCLGEGVPGHRLGLSSVIDVVCRSCVWQPPSFGAAGRAPSRPSPCPTFATPRSFPVPSEVKIAAETRTEFGKGAARRIRRADKVPAVLYGHGTDPVHITLPGHETLLALRQANALLSIEVDGGSQLALPKQVQRDPIKHTIEHVDLLLVRRGEKVTVDIPVLIEGEAAPDTLVDVVANTVSVEAEATHIPQQIVVSIEGLQAGIQILL